MAIDEGKMEVVNNRKQDARPSSPAQSISSSIDSVRGESVVGSTRSSSEEMQVITNRKPQIVLGKPTAMRSPVKIRKTQAPVKEITNDKRVDKLNPDDEIVSIHTKLTMDGFPTVYVVKVKGSSRTRKVPASELTNYPDLLADYNSGRRGREATNDDVSGQSDNGDGFSDNEGPSEVDDPMSEDGEDYGRSTRSRNKPVRRTTKARQPKAAPEPTRRSNRQTRHQAAFVDETEFLDRDNNEMEVDDQSEDGGAASDNDSDIVIVTNKPKATISVAKPKAGRVSKNTTKLSLKWGDAEDIDTETVSSLANHRVTCEKCSLSPAAYLLKTYNANRKRSKKQAYNRADIDAMGAWVECAMCCVAYHYGCLPNTVQADITRTVKAEEAKSLRDSGIGSDSEANAKPAQRLVKRELSISQVIGIPSCPMCNKAKGTTCSICKKEAVDNGPAAAKPENSVTNISMASAPSTPPAKSVKQEAIILDDSSSSDIEVVIGKYSSPTKVVRNTSPDVEIMVARSSSVAVKAPSASAQPALLFRCTKCKRATHYECLHSKAEEGFTAENNALNWQNDWTCHDCARWNFRPDVILAWRPVGTEQGDAVAEDFPRPTAKETTADIEYLVKWENHSYRYVEWVPHAFLAASYPSKLLNFLRKGSDLVRRMAEGEDTDEEGAPILNKNAFGRAPNPGAESDIPKDWGTIDRIIDIRYVTSTGRSVTYTDIRPKPNAADPEASVHSVHLALIKWQSLPTSAVTWDEFAPSDPDWDAFVQAYARWLRLHKIRIPKLNPQQIDAWEDAVARQKAQRIGDIQPDYIGGQRNLKLMDFQRLGVDWLYTQWKKRHPCVLSDEMGLGKTVQVISFLTHIHKIHQAQPFLVVVPNSTIANWLREFATWAPEDMKVIGYFGDAASRKIIEDNELLIQYGGTVALKARVIICTYESIVSGLPVFRKMQYFETLVVDEAQRLKAGQTGKLFHALNALTFGQRLLLTGTPLNNSVGEIFNLMHFLDPGAFHDLPGLVQKYQDVNNKEIVQEIQDLLKPYFLRRTKEEVLDLPSLVEVILPVSLRPLQKKLYKQVVAKNVESIESMFRKNKSGKAVKRASFNNVLMKLRQICQSAYLFSPEIEVEGLSEKDTASNLVDASSKLTLLAKLLPKLIQRGHRILLFSQFLGVLDLMSRFLTDLDIPFTSLSGSTMQSERQEAIDSYNAPDSKLKVFLLTTRAGGVGINLTTADTVILFDQDFNPMQDLQAISRAHRIGQTKPVICYKLVNKATCEEKIIIAGRKKMVLEHLIIQKMSQEDMEDKDVEDVLQYGAKNIFESGEGESESDIRYNDAKIDEILDRHEAEAAKPPVKNGVVNKAFSYAKIWETDSKDVEEEESEDVKRNFWQNVLREQMEEQERLEAERADKLGRGRRERKYIMDLRNTYREEYDSDGKGSSSKKAGGKTKKDGQRSDDDFANNPENIIDSSDNETNEASSAAITTENTNNIEPSLLMMASPRRRKTSNEDKRHFDKDSPMKAKQKRKSLLHDPLLEGDSAVVPLYSFQIGNAAPTYSVQPRPSAADARLPSASSRPHQAPSAQQYSQHQQGEVSRDKPKSKKKHPSEIPRPGSLHAQSRLLEQHRPAHHKESFPQSMATQKPQASTSTQKEVALHPFFRSNGGLPAEHNANSALASVVPRKRPSDGAPTEQNPEAKRLRTLSKLESKARKLGDSMWLAQVERVKRLAGDEQTEAIMVLASNLRRAQGKDMA